MAQILRYSLQLAASVPAHLAFHWGQLPLVSGVIERRSENALRRRLCMPELLPAEADVVAGVERQGVWLTDIGALGLDGPGLSDIVECGKRLTADVASQSAAGHAARRAMTTALPSDLIRYPAIYRWGLNAVLLRIAEAYLRRPVAYDGAQLHLSPADGQEAGTRRWHLDREDARMLKVALYLHTVDEAGGPFQILEQEAPREDGRFDYPIMTDAQLQTRLGPQRTTTCTVRPEQWSSPTRPGSITAASQQPHSRGRRCSSAISPGHRSTRIFAAAADCRGGRPRHWLPGCIQPRSPARSGATSSPGHPG
jgi:hypothetical protein